MSKNSNYTITQDRMRRVFNSLPATEEQAKSFFHTLDQGGKAYSNLGSGSLYNAASATYNLGINLPGAVNNFGSLIYNGFLAYAKSSDIHKDLVDPIFTALNEDKESRDKLVNTLSVVFKESKNQIKHNSIAVKLLKSKDQEIAALQDKLNNLIKDNKKDWQFLRELKELEEKEKMVKDDFYYEQMDEDLSKIAARKEELNSFINDWKLFNKSKEIYNQALEEYEALEQKKIQGTQNSNEKKIIDDRQEELAEIAMEYGQKIANSRFQFLDKYNQLEEEMNKLQKEREEIARNLGVVSSSLLHYTNIVQDINDKDFLNEILTAPEYQFVFNTPQDQLKENEINIKRENDKWILESKLGHKTLELKKHLSTDLENSIENSIKSGEMKLSKHELDTLKALAVNNNFPGVLHHAYKNLEAFIKMPADMDPEHPEMAKARTEMVNGFVELLTQEHVRESVKPLATEKLVDDIFELPQISPAIKEYHQLVNGMANSEPKKFKELFGAILESKGFPQYINDLMNFIGSPSIPEIIDTNGKKIFDENTPEFRQANDTYDKSMVSLIEALEPNVIAKAIPLVNETLVKNIMALPVLQDLEKEEVINKAKAKASELSIQLLSIISELEIESLPVANDAVLIMDEGKEENLEVAEAEITSLPLAFAETVNEEKENELVAEPVKNLEEQITIAKEKITELRNNAVDKNDIKIYDGILKDLEGKNIRKLKKDQESLESNLTNSFVKKLEKERGDLPQKQSNEISPIKKKLIETIYKIANNTQDCRKLQKAMIDNKDTLKTALNVIFSPKDKTALSEVLKDFGVTSEEIVSLLPKICTKNGIKALGRVIENPNITNTVNLLYQTNYLGSAIAHAGQGACSYAYKWAVKTFVGAKSERQISAASN